MCEVKELTKGARHSRSDDNQELIEFPHPTLICIRIKSNTCGLELEGLQERPLPHSPLHPSLPTFPPSPLSSLEVLHPGSPSSGDVVMLVMLVMLVVSVNLYGHV